MNSEFSYDVLKTIVKYTPMEKRKETAKKIPSYRVAHKKAPYIFDELCIEEQQFSFKIGNLRKQWFIREKRVLEEGDEPGTKIFYADSNRQEARNNLKMSVVEAKDTWVKEFVRKGTRTRVLCASAKAPAGMNSVGLKADVVKLTEQSSGVVESWKSIIENSPYKQIRLLSSVEHKDLLTDPLIINCQKLQLNMCRCFAVDVDNEYRERAKDWYNGLESKDIVLVGADFWNSAIDMFAIVLEVLADWLTRDRPIGVVFGFRLKDFDRILDVFDKATEQFHAIPSKRPEINSSLCHCVTIPLDQEREMVLYGDSIEQTPGGDCWVLNLEVMKKGSTVPKNVVAQ